MLIASVIDNGKGFDLTDEYFAPSRNIDYGGFGIYSMKQRAELMKGKFSINSRVGKGTTVRIEIPLNPQEKE